MIKDIYLGAGCFWGAERFLRQIRGVVFTEVGYANGNISHPTYREVATDSTGYAEAVHVKYDTDIIGLERLVQIYFKAVDPSAVNRQGNDVGIRYRSGIWYSDSKDLPSIRRVYDRFAGGLKAPIAIELKPLKNFYRAEEEHQNYLEKNPQGYCHIPESAMEFARSMTEIAAED